MKRQLFSAIMGLSILPMSAQVWVTDVPLDVTGVSNDGIVVGTPNQNCPFYLWNPKTQDLKEIGGMSSGQGIGGVGRISADGKFVAAPAPFDAIPQLTKWVKSEYANCKDFKFKGIYYFSDFYIYAFGTSPDGKTPVLMKTSNNGNSWRSDNENLGSQIESGIECMANMSNYHIFAGCHGALYLGRSNGSWSKVAQEEVAPKDETGTVKTWWAIDFLGDVLTSTPAQYGVFGVEFEDGRYAVWQTSDQTETFTAATGVSGVPAHITHMGDIFYMVTQNGHIQKSEDKGLTWSDIFTTPDNAPLYRIRFADEMKAIAVSDNVVYITTDGGKTWKQTEVLPVSINPCAEGKVVWNDAVWSGDEIVVVGDGGLAFRSKDNGKSFAELDLGSEETGDIGALSFFNGSWNIVSSTGNFYKKATAETIEGFGGGIYDVENNTWTSLASLGYDQDGKVSSPWGFTENGRFVTGGIINFSSLANNTQNHAALFEGTEKVIDLGSRYEAINRNSMAMASSADGSVVVGWQDIFGPRYGIVWRKSDQGGYTMKMLLKDPTKTEDDFDPATTPKQEFYDNFIGGARSVSADGKWIGGDGRDGDNALHGPWIWSEETGYQVLFEEDGAVSDFSSDGSVAIGWKYLGSNAWMWTKEKGVQDLNDYARNVLGQDLGDFYIMSAYDISPNGRYITGYGMIGDQFYGYMMDITGTSTGIGDKITAQTKVSVYPNPVSDILHIDMPYGSETVKTTLTLVDAQGRVVRKVDNAPSTVTIDVSALSRGLYVLDVNAAGSHKSYKIMIK